MAEELDYRLEAAVQATFAAAFAGDADFAIPAVVTGTEHVIVSEWLEGNPLSQIISDGTPEERDDASQLYLEFLLAGPAEAGLLHADPHPGNFRMTPDSRLGVIDFGAVNRLPDGMPPEIGPLLSTGLGGSAQQVLDGLREIGFVRSGIDLDPERLLDYLEPFMAPFREDEFTFSRGLAPRGLRAHQRPAPAELRGGYKLNLPPEYLLIHRVWGGQHRCALPARGHGARTRDRRRAPAGGGPAADRPARLPADAALTTRRGRACPRSSAGARGCNGRRSTSCGRRRSSGSRSAGPRRWHRAPGTVPHV